MRLEKYISDSGVASRRAVKRAIREGHVTVNGTIITIPGTSRLIQKPMKLNIVGIRLNQ